MKKISHISLGMLALLLAAALFSPACYYDNETDLYPGTTCDTSAVTYSANIGPLIISNCASSGCHDAATQEGGVILQTYGNVKAKVDDGRIQVRVIDEQSMPPSAPLSACQIAQIRVWMRDGAPNN